MRATSNKQVGEEEGMKDKKSTLMRAIRSVRNIIYEAVTEQLADENRTYQQIADSVGCSLATVQRVAQLKGISRPVGPRPKSATTMEANDGNA
jgi:hypothetical protein